MLKVKDIMTNDVITVTPDTAGEFTVVCNEFCGIGHHLMLGKIYVREN